MAVIAADLGMSAPRVAQARSLLAAKGSASRDEVFNTLQSGRWFAELSGGWRDAIVARSHVQRVAASTRITQRGDAAGNWVGVARGAVRLGTALAEELDDVATGHTLLPGSAAQAD